MPAPFWYDVFLLARCYILQLAVAVLDNGSQFYG